MEQASSASKSDVGSLGIAGSLFMWLLFMQGVTLFDNVNRVSLRNTTFLKLFNVKNYSRSVKKGVITIKESDKK